MEWPEESPELFQVTATEDGDVTCFVKAMRSLLDEGDSSKISTLARRLSPFRIELQHKNIPDHITVAPILIFEENQASTCYRAHLAANAVLNDTPVATQEGSFLVSRVNAAAPTGNYETIAPGSLIRGESMPEAEDEAMEVAVCHSGRNQTNDFTPPNPGLHSTSSDGPVPQPLSLSPDESSPPPSNWCHGLVSGFYGFDTDSQTRNAPVAALHFYPEPVTTTTPPSSRATPCSPPLLRPAAAVSELQRRQPQPGAQRHGNHMSPPSTASSGASTLVNAATTSPESSCTSPSSRGSRRCHRTAASTRADESCDDTAAAETPDRDQPQQRAAQKGMLPITAVAAHTCISLHSIQFLEANLARWCRHGLWRDSSPLISPAAASLSGYEKLQRAYSFVCRLDTRISDDAIRSRMAMVTLHLEYENTCRRGHAASCASTSVGRGHTSSTIDSILESVHADWGVCEAREKAALRTKFHEWKRFGKRWWLLANIVGPSIMLLASARFAGMVKNTTVTTAMLSAAGHTIKTTEPHIMTALRLTNPLTKSLLCNKGYENHDTQLLSEKLLDISLHFREASVV